VERRWTQALYSHNKWRVKMLALKKIALTALAAVTITGSSVAMSGAADAQGWHGGRGGYGGGYGRGYGGYGRGYGGYGIGAGVVTGLALGAYGANRYYAGDCWIQRRVVIDQYGRRHVRPVRVCG
jgi:hypothetical protein